MNNDFSLEIESLNESSKIDNKLMVFSIYFDLYNAIVRKLNVYSESLASSYGSFLTSTFKLAVIGSNFKDENIDCDKFIDALFKLLNYYQISNIEIVKEIIDYYKDNLNELMDTMQYVNIINEMDIDFDTKARVVMILREHINNVFGLFIQVYGEDESYDIRHKLLNSLTDSLPRLLAGAFDLDLFRADLKLETKNIIEKYFDNNEFNFLKFKEKYFGLLFDTLDELETKIYLLGFPYALAGYQNNDPDLEKMKLNEACKKLNISRTRYLMKSFSLAIKIIKWGKMLSEDNGYSKKR